MHTCPHGNASSESTLFTHMQRKEADQTVSTSWMRSSFTSTEGMTGPEQSCADLPTGPIKEHPGMLEVLASPSSPDSDPASSPLPPPNLC